MSPCLQPCHRLCYRRCRRLRLLRPPITISARTNSRIAPLTAIEWLWPHLLLPCSVERLNSCSPSSHQSHRSHPPLVSRPLLPLSSPQPVDIVPQQTASVRHCLVHPASDTRCRRLLPLTALVSSARPLSLSLLLSLPISCPSLPSYRSAYRLRWSFHWRLRLHSARCRQLHRSVHRCLSLRLSRTAHSLWSLSPPLRLCLSLPYGRCPRHLLLFCCSTVLLPLDPAPCPADCSALSLRLN